METKRCNACKHHLPLAAFTKDASRADGLAAACRNCRSAMKRAYYFERGGKTRVAEYQKSDKRRDYETEREARPERREAQHRRYERNLVTTCITCGATITRHRRHLNLAGCRSCAVGGFDANRPGYIYLLIHDDGYHKIGISNDPDRRIIEHMRNNYQLVDRLGPAAGHTVARAERDALSARNKAGHRPVPHAPIDGRTETFPAELDITDIWADIIADVDPDHSAPVAHVEHQFRRHRRRRKVS